MKDSWRRGIAITHLASRGLRGLRNGHYEEAEAYEQGKARRNIFLIANTHVSYLYVQHECDQNHLQSPNVISE